MNTKTVTQTFQQGDVVGRKLDTMPEGKQTVIGRQTLVIAHGENGHSHVIEDDEAELVRIGERMILTLTKAATVKHEEHKAIRLSPGIWEIGRVREYDYFSLLTRQVID